MDFTKYDCGGNRPIIFGVNHFLLITENEFTHEIKRDGITSLHGIHDKLFLNCCFINLLCCLLIAKRVGMSELKSVVESRRSLRKTVIVSAVLCNKGIFFYTPGVATS